MFHRVIWQLLTDVSKELTACITKIFIVMTKAVLRPSETSVNIYQIARCNIPEVSQPPVVDEASVKSQGPEGAAVI
jgi:hypothetical protein